MSTIVELAKNVDRAKEQLARAEQQLLAALTGTSPSRRNGSVRPPGLSTAARVLSFVVEAGAEGVTRADINAKFPGQEKAVHSALKYQSAQKKIWSDDGKWKDIAVKKIGGRGAKPSSKKAQAPEQ